MANTILITANWHTGALSQQTISRQYDNNRYAVRFVGYPEASDGNELDYYLLVWMSTAPGQKPGEIMPIQLNSDQWYISNYFTQQVQVIKFQLCVLNEAGTYEAHSPIFSGRIGDSLEHDGTSQDIDVSTLFDAYREYVEELIIRAGAVIIDPTLTQSGQAADAKVVGDKIAKTFDGKLGFSLIPNSYITTTGVITEYNNWSRTDYLHCNEYRKLTVYNGSGSNSQYNAFYKQDLTFISKFTCGANEARTFDIPTDAAFFICSNNTNAMNTYTFRLSDSRVYDDIVLMNNKIDSIDTSVDEISEIVNPTNWFHDFVAGSYLSPSGAVVESDAFGMTGYIPIKQNDTVMRWKDGVYQTITQINEFDSLKQFIRRVTPSGGYPFAITDSDVSYITLTLATTTMGGEQIIGINRSDPPVYSEYFTPYRTAKIETDETLSKSGKPADAKVVGNRFVALGENISTISFDGTAFVITGKDYKLYITHQTSSAIRQDVWRVNRGSIVDNGTETDMWNGSDADGVLHMANETDFVGGYHGDEITQSISVYVDGEIIDMTSPFSSKSFSSFLMFVSSDVYHCNEDADANYIAFKRNKIIAFKDGELEISNLWKAQKTVNMTIAYIGMLSVRRSLISAYTINNTFALTDKDTATPAVDYGRFGKMILTTGNIIDYEVKNGSNRAPKGSAVSYTGGSGVSDRIKFYFSTISKTDSDPITLSSGDVIYGQSVIKIK